MRRLEPLPATPAVSSTAPPSSDGGEEKRKRSKWDVVAETEPRPAAPMMTSKVAEFADQTKYRLIRMQGNIIRVLIGRGGETIREVVARSGADIKIQHLPHEPEGSISIVGNIEKTEAVIAEVLATKGVVWSPRGPSGPIVTDDDIRIEPELVGLLIGKGGESIKEIKEKCGGAVSISVQKNGEPGALQIVRVVGDNYILAKELVRAKILDIKKAMGWKPPAAKGGAKGGPKGWADDGQRGQAVLDHGGPSLGPTPGQDFGAFGLPNAPPRTGRAEGWSQGQPPGSPFPHGKGGPLLPALPPGWSSLGSMGAGQQALPPPPLIPPGPGPPLSGLQGLAPMHQKGGSHWTA